MDRRDFIKLTAITGTSATLASCGNPEHQLIRFVPDEDTCRAIAEWKPSVCPLCAAGCGLTVRVMEADVETTREGQAGRRQDGRREEARRQPDEPDQPGRAVRARPGGDSGHLSSRSPDAADEAHGARGGGTFQEIRLGRALAELVVEARRLAAAGDQKALAFVSGAPAAAAPGASTVPRQVRRSGTNRLRAVRGRRAAACERLSFGHEQLPTLDLARRDS